MSPVGSEPGRTYWVRRILVVVSILLVVAVGFAVVKAILAKPGGDAGRPVAAVPPASESARAAGNSAASQTPARTPVISTAGASSSALVTPGSTARPTPTPVACDPGAIHLGITGPATVRLGGAAARIKVGWTSTSAVSCVLDLAAHPFEVKVYSGADRIWSTLDCPKGIPTGRVTLMPAKATVLDAVWPLQRSASGCTLTDNLRAGTYVATAVIEGGTPVQHVLRVGAR